MGERWIQCGLGRVIEVVRTYSGHMINWRARSMYKALNPPIWFFCLSLLFAVVCRPINASCGGEVQDPAYFIYSCF